MRLLSLSAEGKQRTSFGAWTTPYFSTITNSSLWRSLFFSPRITIRHQTSSFFLALVTVCCGQSHLLDLDGGVFLSLKNAASQFGFSMSTSVSPDIPRFAISGGRHIRRLTTSSSTEPLTYRPPRPHQNSPHAFCQVPTTRSPSRTITSTTRM